MDNEQLKANVTSGKQWVRLLYMVFYAIALYFATIAMWILVVLQFLFALITGKDNAQLRSFGYSLSTYLYEVYKFLTYSSDEKPFPFADWPDTPEEIKAKVGEIKTQSSANPDVKPDVVTPAQTFTEATAAESAPEVVSEAPAASQNDQDPVKDEPIIHLSSDETHAAASFGEAPKNEDLKDK